MSLKDMTHLEMFWERQRKSCRGLHSLSFWLAEQKGNQILFLGSQLVVIPVAATKKTAYGKSKNKIPQFIEK